MSSQQEKAAEFAALHIKNDPVILFNVWDAGTAKTVAGEGAKAIALGSHGVAEALGYEDGEHLPLELVLENARRVVKAVDVPVTLDFETGYGDSPDDVKTSVMKALEAGIVGINIEDKIPGKEGLYSIDEQVERLQAARAAADEFGVDLFINARTDLFKSTEPAEHNDALVDAALERAKAFADAGTNGFFAPIVLQKEHMQRLANESPLPVNIIWLPGMDMPSPKEIASLNVSRISYGPGPWLEMNQWLKEKASLAFS